MTTAASERVVVVGAGIGALVAALELAAAGRDVLVLERAATPGGKIRQVHAGGCAIDAGPTVFTMRWVFDELFASVGTSVEQHLTLSPLATLARHAWGDGSRLDLFADIDASVAAIAAFAGATQAEGYRAFCERAQRIYRTLEQPFLRGSKPSPVTLAQRVGLRRLPDLLAIAPFASMWAELGRYFTDPRLQQLFGRYATYCGSSPWQAPATLMLVAHVEQQGVWAVEGGMHRLATTLAGLASAHGARIRYGAHVAEVTVAAGRASGVRLASGEHVAAGTVVFNGDAGALAAGALGTGARHASPPVYAHQRSLSAVTWALAAPTGGFPLLRHNVFFGGDYRAEFASIFKQGRLPVEPTVYVCAQDREDAGAAPAAGAPERLLCLVNAPATGDTTPPTPMELAECEARTFQMLARCGLQVAPEPQHTVRTTPQDFERAFPATGGALYGRASHGWMASFSRPGARSRLPGLYLAGGSTHPGPGVPMAALSGRQAAASVMADRASTPRFHPVATAGGTSMR